LHTLLAYANALSTKPPPDARPTVSVPILCIGCADVHQQCLVAKMAAPGYLSAPRQMLVISGYQQRRGWQRYPKLLRQNEDEEQQAPIR
jgi:hypothetical protein